MEYISVKEAAKAWNITVRTVQRYCQKGYIQGVKKYGKSWLIPKEASKPEAVSTSYVPYLLFVEGMPLSDAVLQGDFHEIDDPQIIKQLKAELAYLKGEYTVAKAHVYSVSPSDSIWFSACYISMLAAISLGDYATFRTICFKLEQTPKQNPMVSHMIDIIHNSIYVSAYAPNLASDWLKKGEFKNFPHEMVPHLLFVRMKYMQNHGYWLENLGIAQTTLTIYETWNLVPIKIYYLLICAECSMRINQKKEAQMYIKKAMDLGLKFDIITPFVEFRTNLSTLIETEFEAYDSELYERLVKQWHISYRGWTKFHNLFTKDHLTDLLTAREYRIANNLLLGKSYAEIASIECLSEGRIRNIIHDIYGKLMIHNKNELKEYIYWHQTPKKKK